MPGASASRTAVLSLNRLASVCSRRSWSDASEAVTVKVFEIDAQIADFISWNIATSTISVRKRINCCCCTPVCRIQVLFERGLQLTPSKNKRTCEMLWNSSSNMRFVYIIGEHIILVRVPGFLRLFVRVRVPEITVDELRMAATVALQLTYILSAGCEKLGLSKKRT